jgi:hypothetical protein
MPRPDPVIAIGVVLDEFEELLGADQPSRYPGRATIGMARKWSLF